jgi:hypothetical protein
MRRKQKFKMPNRLSLNNYDQIKKYALIKLVYELMHCPQNVSINETDKRIMERAEIKFIKFIKYISRRNVKRQGRKMNIRQFLKIHDLNEMILEK